MSAASITTENSGSSSESDSSTESEESEDLMAASQQSTKRKAGADTETAGWGNDADAGDVPERAAIFDAKVVCSTNQKLGN